MFKAGKQVKNFLSSNDMIIKSMFKRRRLALAAIAHIYDNKKNMYIVK